MTIECLANKKYVCGLLYFNNITKHAMNRFEERDINFIKKNFLTLEKNCDKIFIVDRNHRNGKEYHLLLRTGLIIIANIKSKMIITILYGRRKQFKRYYEAKNLICPSYLIDIGIRNERQKKNLL